MIAGIPLKTISNMDSCSVIRLVSGCDKVTIVLACEDSRLSALLAARPFGWNH